MVFLLLVLVVSGLIAFKNLPIEAFPDVSDTQVTVIGLYPGRAAEEVERQLTLPVEVALSGLPDSVRLFLIRSLGFLIPLLLLMIVHPISSHGSGSMNGFKMSVCREALRFEFSHHRLRLARFFAFDWSARAIPPSILGHYKTGWLNVICAESQGWRMWSPWVALSSNMRSILIWPRCGTTKSRCRSF